MCDIVWVSPQEHWSESESFHFFLQAPQWPCPVRKRFRRDHCCRGRAKPGCRIVGVVHKVCIDHRGRLPGFSPLTVDVSWFRLTPQRLSGCEINTLKLPGVGVRISLLKEAPTSGPICFIFTYFLQSIWLLGNLFYNWNLSLIHIWRCRRIERCRSRWSPYH